jgi:hypothetical protein
MRNELILTLAKVIALTRTATNTNESLHWEARQWELERRLGPLTRAEEAYIAREVARAMASRKEYHETKTQDDL